MSDPKYNTFWKIIIHNRIEIPTIQRDYAYGRRSANSIRVKLINDIFESLRSSKPLNLDFVYGKLLGKENQAAHERNRNNVQSLLKSITTYAKDLGVDITYNVDSQNIRTQNKINFIPLDGQQRLTTLYLFHWYLCQINKDNESLNILNGFSYSTRVSSKDFCKMLCDYQFGISTSTKVPSEIIGNHEKYFSFWNKDPTVKSMLVVIDEIHKTFNEVGFDGKLIWQALTCTDIISFDFFDLDDFELTDELYIKMNARGKQLTNFEKFKAWMIKECSEYLQLKDWRIKLDIRWCDIFWKAKESVNRTIDAEYLQFFKIAFLGDYIKTVKADKNEMDDESDLDSYNTDELNLDDFRSVIGVLRKKDANPVDVFKNSPLFKNKLEDYLKILDESSFDVDANAACVQKYLQTRLSKLLFGDKLNNLTWWDITLHYAVSRYLGWQGYERKYFHQWVRVIANLIYNTRIDTPQLFKDAVSAIDSIMTKITSESVFSVFSKFDEGEITFFSTNQKKEEIQKAKLILEDQNWENILIEAENHNYFYGQIGFILNICKNPVEIADFITVFEKVSVLFGEEILNEPTYLLTRCFLTLGDCFYHEGDNRIFNSNVRGTLRNRTENWRKFFEQKYNFISKLINHMRFDKNDIIHSLNQIIQFELPNLSPSYTSIFVNNYVLFDYPKRNHIRKYGEGYYLLNKTRISGYFVELYTYAWFKQNEVIQTQRNPSAKVTYKAAKGEDNDPCIAIEEQGIVCEIKLDYKSGRFIVTKNNSNSEFMTIDEAVQTII